MTPRLGNDAVQALIGRVRVRLRLRSLIRATALALFVLVAAAVMLIALDLLIDLSAGSRLILRWVPLSLLLYPVVLLVRGWVKVDDRRVALLIDERSLLGNLVSTQQNPNATGPVADAFHRHATAKVRDVNVAGVVPFDGARLWVGAIGAGVLATLLLVGSGGPDAFAARWLDASNDQSRSGVASTEAIGAEASVDPTLGAVRFLVRTPAYADLPDIRGVAGETVSALPGSTVEISGDGTALAPTLSALVVGGAPLTMRTTETGWATEWRVGPDHRGVALEVGTNEGLLERRVLPLQLLRDRSPSVELATPASDVVLASATGRIPIAALATDDYGVADLKLHWVRSSGSGESFDFAEGQWEWDRSEATSDGRTAELSLSLDELDLRPGDVVHIRATAYDENTVTGPGFGVSATRQIRIAREDDLAEVTTLVGFPIERDREPLLSQRMIILLTEELRDSAHSMSGEELMDASQEIADEQARLRARIGEQIFSRATGAMQDPEAHLDFEEGEAEVFLDELEGLVEQGPLIDPTTGIANVANVDIPAHEHDSDPIVAINRSLLTVYNYMWDAERELQSAQLDPSLVPQHLALEELQRVRDSERIFARGRVSVAPIDVPAARGTGEVEDVVPSARSAAGPPLTDVNRVMARAEELLTDGAAIVGRAAAIEISGLALDVLRVAGNPDVSEALVRAATQAEAGDALRTREGLLHALRLMGSTGLRSEVVTRRAPSTLASARYLRSRPEAAPPPQPTTDAPSEPFVFATVRYQSGDWDSAPLVPNNLIHSMAQYTDLEVMPEGVVVDLASAEVFDYPFLYLTGHLPVFFNEAESRNLVDFVDRGGFLFVDDHNHDIDGAFHRSVTSELQRLFGAERWAAIPNEHELYTSFFEFDDGPPITGHELSGWGDGLIHRELFGVSAGDRIGVLYSNKDYSSEWSYHSDNKRFLAVDNTRFGVNVIVYALTR